MSLVMLCFAGATAAQSGPVVKENTGDLRYLYPLTLPTARGRFQPSLALVYSSESTVNRGYGYGWDLSPFYVEGTAAGGFLVRGELRDPVTQSEQMGIYTVYAIGEPLRFEHSFTDPNASWTMIDGLGTRYGFSRRCGRRWYLTSVVDLDGNVAQYEYGSTCSEGLQTLSYNLTKDPGGYPRNPDAFAHRVVLEYAQNWPGSIENVAGVFVHHRARLTGVKVEGPVVGGARRTLRYYQLTPTGSATSAADPFWSIQSITEKGIDGSADGGKALPPTVFTYDQAFDLELSQSPIGQWAPGAVETDSVEWVDLDGDGLTDLKVGTRWARSQGGAGGLLSFGPLTDIVRTSSGYAEPGVVSSGLQDFDGDGVVDYLAPAPYRQECWSDLVPRLKVRFGKRDSVRGLVFDSSACADHWNVLSVACGGGITELSSPGCLVLGDVNGDRILDYSARVDSGMWSVFLGRKTGATWSFTQTEELTRVPDGRTATTEWAPYDINGDGLIDAVSRALPAAQWPLAPDTFPEFGGENGALLNVWPASLDDETITDTFLPVGRFGPSDLPPRYNAFGISGTTSGGAACSTQVRDTRAAHYAILDANGDRIPDFVRDAEEELGSADPPSGGWLRLAMGTGNGVSTDRSILDPLGHAPEQARWRAGSTVSAPALAPPSVRGQLCTTFTLAGSGLHSKLVDLDGDGIPDRVSLAQGATTPVFEKGVFVAPDTDNGPNTLAVARPLLLKKVKSHGGAVLTFEFGSSRTFGSRDSTRPVVTHVRSQGPLSVTSDTFYSYESGHDDKYPYWYSPAFKHTWAAERSDDGARAWVRRSTWYLDWHSANRGLASLVEEGPPSSGVVIGSPKPGYELARSVATEWGVCPNNAAYLPLKVTQSQRFPPGETGDWVDVGTITTINCDQVSSGCAWRTWGSVQASTVQEFFQPKGLDPVFGPEVTTVKTLRNPGEPPVPRSISRGYEDFPSCESSCSGIAATVLTEVLSNGLRLGLKTETYDDQCRKTGEWTGTGANRAGLKTYEYYPSGAGTGDGAFGLLKSVTSGASTSTGSTRTGFTYKAPGAFAADHPNVSAVDYLFAWKEVTESLPTGPGYNLQTSSTFDPPTGLLLSRKGPEVAGSTGAATERWYVYDAFARKVATAKQSPPAGYLSSGQVANVVEAAAYHDELGAAPRSVTSYRFAQPMAIAIDGNGAVDPQTNRAMRTIAYLDELGRTVQVRERLGVGATQDPEAEITQGLSGWRVTGSTVYDGAGRVRLVWEPYLVEATGEAFTDPKVNPVSGGTRAIVTTYDALGRPTCVSNEFLSGGVASVGTVCSSNAEHSASFRLATGTSYGVERVGTGPYSGWYVVTDTVSPDQNSTGRSGSTRTYSAPGGAVLGTRDAEGRSTWVLRDALGREVGSWRQGPSERTPNPASRIVYDADTGLVVSRWDANTPTFTQQFTYDDQGRVKWQSAGPSGEHVRYEYLSFGRLTSVKEYTDSQDETPVRETVNAYDLPYDHAAQEYAYTAGKLSSATVTENTNTAWSNKSTTTIAYGYDDAGRLEKRRQYFTALEGKSLTVDSRYGGDGRVFSSRTFGTIGAVATNENDPHLTYQLKYDSAGRPITVTGTPRGSTATVMYAAYNPDSSAAAQWGAFDAHGRPSLIKADDGLAVSARVYDRYSGTLVMECKRVGDLQCENLIPTNGNSGAPGANAARDLYRADSSRATYLGTLLAGYTDNGTGTTYAVSYTSSGKVYQATATSSGTTAGRQSYEETYGYDGIGNLRTAQAKKDRTTDGWGTDLTDTYAPATASGGTILDQVRSISTTKGPGAYPPSSAVVYGYDVLNRLRTINRSGVVETLYYGPTGELMAKQAGTSWTFWVGEYATVTATIPTDCGTSPCAAQDVKLDAHVIFAGTRIASAGTPAGATAARTLYYYRSRLGTVVATSLRGGFKGAVYRYTPYGAVASTSEMPSTASELGYTNALRLSGSLLHLKTRVYDPEMRTFLQVDSVDRQRYAYVRGDPINLHDPTGMLPRVGNENAMTYIWDGMIVDDPRVEAMLDGYSGDMGRRFGRLLSESQTKALRWALLMINPWWGDGPTKEELAAAENSSATGCGLTINSRIVGSLWSQDTKIQSRILIALARASKSALAVNMLEELLNLTNRKGVQVVSGSRNYSSTNAATREVTLFGTQALGSRLAVDEPSLR